MKIITRQDLADRLRGISYPLDVQMKPEELDHALGHGDWTRLTCRACGKDVARVVEFEVSALERIRICADCVIQMADLFAVTK